MVGSDLGAKPGFRILFLDLVAWNGAHTLPSHGDISPAESGCGACRRSNDALFPFTMAFQPILHGKGIFAYEALVRGPHGESAGSILGQVDEENRYAFDQACRVKAIELSAGLQTRAGKTVPSAELVPVSINFLPGAVYKPETCIRRTLETAARVGIDLDKIIFEVTEGEQVGDRSHLLAIFHEYRKLGLRTAIDDFGAGYAGLDLLAAFQPDILKLDMALVRDIDSRPPSRAIVRAVAAICEELGIDLIAEGVETVSELQALEDLGIRLFQGYLFARPQLETMAAFYWPGVQGIRQLASMPPFSMAHPQLPHALTKLPLEQLPGARTL